MQELLERKKGLHRSVLIVDDEFIEREMLGAMLSDIYEVSYAENGSHALDIIKRDKLTLSLVILDLHMPELDGYSLLKIIRSDSELRRIPVIVLTSEKDAEVKSLQLGAADFITKPYEAPDVIDALKLDMKFIRNICTNPKDYRLVGIMIDIARLLEVPVIAEGVETKEQMELLKAGGCDIIQGYYFSKPLPPEDFDKLIEAELKEGQYAYN